MAQIETWLSCDLKKPVSVQMLKGVLFSQDNQANKIGVRVYDDGEAVTMTGTVTGNIIRSDGGTVTVTGTASGNEAYIILPQAAYVYTGVITIAIKITSNSVVTTLAAAVGTVYASTTDTAVDPGTIIPSIETLISQIQAAVASIPADYSSLWTSLAPAFNPSRSGGYKAGEYCTNGGVVYICTVDHTGSWNASHFASTNIGEQLTATKSALSDKVDESDFNTLVDAVATTNIVTTTTNIRNLLTWTSGYVGANGTVQSSSSYTYSNKIPVTEGDVLNVSDETYPAEIRFLAAFSDLNTVVESAGSNTGMTTYTVPSGIKYVIITIYSTMVSSVPVNKTHTETYYENNLKPDVDALEDAVSDLNSDVDDLTDITTATKTTTTTYTLSPVWTSGYCEPTTGIVRSSESYYYSESISVSEGDVIYVHRQSDGGVIADARFMTAYLDNAVQADKGGNNVTFPYTVPTGVDALVFSILVAYGSGSTITRVHTESELIDKMQQPVENLYQIAQNGKKNSFEYTFDVAAGGSYSTDKSLEDECGYRICFTAKLSSLTGEIKINKGTDSAYGAGFGIDANNIYVYLGTSTTPARTQPHGLSIADYIAITIDSKYIPSATVVISTNGGTYTWEVPYWSSIIGVLQVVSTLDALSDCFLSYACEGVTTDTWVYGDSYLLNRDNTRWPYYLVYKGYTKFLLNGYGGRTSDTALQSLKTDLALNRFPKRIVWTLGMNDKDGESVPNTNWMNVINELISICEAYSIELILSTVPNVPATTTKNTLKNAWVRNSGYRYIDFANAISANGDSTWYSGMIHTDNVHPTAQGAIALYHCAVTAVPELLL